MPTETDIRKNLEQRLASLLLRHGKLEASRRHEEGLPNDWEERANLLANDEVLEAIDAHDRQDLVAIRDALARMKQGSYGRCETCQAPIGARRLEALPFATHCMDCAV